MPIYLALASWRKHPSAWRWTRSWRRSPNRENHCPSSPARDLDTKMTKETCVVFYPEALQPGAGARGIANHIRTPHTHGFRARGISKGSRARSQTGYSLQTRSQVKRRSQSNDGSYSPFQFKPCLRFQQYSWCDSVSNCPTGELARGWAHSALQKKLGADLIRPIDPSGSGGVPSGADGDPLPEKGASGNPVERQHGLHDIRRGGEPLQEASHKGGTQKGGSVPEPDFPGPEEEWLTTPGGQFETAQSPAGEKEIQDGRGKDNQGPSETGGLDGVHRPQGCISFSPNSPQPPAIPEVLLERSDIRVSMPCIRAQQCSQGVHKAIKASGSTPEKERNPLHDLSGRHASDGPRQEGAKEPDPGDSFPLPAVGLPDQSREVSPDPFSDNPLLGVHSGLKKVDAVPSRGEDRSNSECLQDSDAQSPGVSTRAGKTHRENVSSYAGYPSSPIMLSGAASSEDQILGCIPELRDRSGPGQSIIGRAEVVDDRSEEMERTFHSAPTARPHHRDRRISSGMGSCFRQEQHGGSVVRSREDSAYQPAGVDRGSICNSGFHEGSEKYSHSVEDGQHNGDIVHQSHGRYEISGPLTCSLRAMAVVPSERDHHHSGAPTGGLQCGSRSRVPHPEVNRMDVGRQGVQKNSLSPGAAHDRFICLPAEQPAGKVCQLAAQSICSAIRCRGGRR